MKILQIIPGLSLRYGGPTHVMIMMCRELRSKGVGTDIVTTDADVDGNLKVALGIPTKVDGTIVYYFSSPFLHKYGFSLGLTRWLRTNSCFYDLLHIHGLFSFITLPAVYFANRYRIPYIIRPSGVLNPWPMKKNVLLKRCHLELFGRRQLDGAAALHFTSEEEATAIERLNLKAPGVVIPHGVDEIYLNNPIPKGRFKTKFPHIKNKKLVLFLSRIDPKKGLELLLQAVKILSERRKDFILIIAGAGEDAYEDKIKGIVRDNNLEEKVIFTGFVQGEEKLSLLKDSDVFVLPSYDENFGVAVAEAMASSLPVCVSKGVNISPKIKEYGAGIVTGYQPEEVASALESLLNDDSLRIEMGGNGKGLVEEVYNWRIIGQRLKELYEALLSGNKPIREIGFTGRM